MEVDTIPGHLPQAWWKPRGVPIPNTQFYFGGDEEDGGDELEGYLSFLLRLRLRTEFSSFSSWISTQAPTPFCINHAYFPTRDEKG